MNTKAILDLLANETGLPITEIKTIFYSIKVNHEFFVPVNSMDDLDEFRYQGTITIELQYHPLYVRKVAEMKNGLNGSLYDRSFHFKEILESQSDPDGCLKQLTHFYGEKLVLTFDIED